MSYLDTITDRPLTAKELYHQEYTTVMGELAELRNDHRFYRLVPQLQVFEDFYISEPHTHYILKDLPEFAYPNIIEFREVLAQYTKRLEAIAQVNVKARAVGGRKGCFELLRYAKKWLGLEMPPNLSKLNLEALRAKVSECFGGRELPKVTHVSYKGVLAILRGLRLAGHKVNLRAKLPVLLGQVIALIPDWEDQYDRLVDAEATYAQVVQEAKATLLTVFTTKPATVASVGSEGGSWVTPIPFKGLVLQAA